jgi:hypothetical protein
MTDKQPSPVVAPMQVPYEEYRARQALEAQRQAEELQMDETVKGGRYLVGDQIVDANGEPVKGEKQEEDAQAAERSPVGRVDRKP